MGVSGFLSLISQVLNCVLVAPGSAWISLYPSKYSHRGVSRENLFEAVARLRGYCGIHDYCYYQLFGESDSRVFSSSVLFQMGGLTLCNLSSSQVPFMK